MTGMVSSLSLLSATNAANRFAGSVLLAFRLIGSRARRFEPDLARALHG